MSDSTAERHKANIRACKQHHHNTHTPASTPPQSCSTFRKCAVTSLCIHGAHPHQLPTSTSDIDPSKDMATTYPTLTGRLSLQTHTQVSTLSPTLIASVMGHRPSWKNAEQDGVAWPQITVSVEPDSPLFVSMALMNACRSAFNKLA